MATTNTIRIQETVAPNDCEVVQRFLAGDEQAFNELVRRYQARLLRFVNRMIGDWERSEDLVQDIFVRVFRSIEGFDQSRKFSTWVYAIARNVARTELRRRSKSREVLFQTLEGDDDSGWTMDYWSDPSPGPDELYRKRRLQATVEEAVEMLPERYRAVFVLRELEERSYEEIAEIADLNVGTVKSRLNRARQHFAEIVAPMID